MAEITKKAYELAKEIVRDYEAVAAAPVEPTRTYTYASTLKEFVSPEERKELAKQMWAIFDKDNYNNPFKDGLIMPCCGQRYVFSYATMKYLKRNSSLRYRENGDVDGNWESRIPHFVQYNNCLEAIRQAKAKGLNHIHWRLSVGCSEAIRKDGYIDHNDELDTISWEKKKRWFFNY